MLVFTVLMPASVPICPEETAPPQFIAHPPRRPRGGEGRLTDDQLAHPQSCGVPLSPSTASPWAILSHCMFQGPARFPPSSRGGEGQLMGYGPEKEIENHRSQSG